MVATAQPHLINGGGSSEDQNTAGTLRFADTDPNLNVLVTRREQQRRIANGEQYLSKESKGPIKSLQPLRTMHTLSIPPFISYPHTDLM